MGSSYTRNLKKIAISLFLASSALSFVSASSSPSASSPPSESPSAETELICHIDNPSDCYPKLFSATEEFQVVHDDQDLPPGLHVQLDVQTGKKQAKLYNPKEENPALEGLPVDRSIVIVDPDPPQDQDDKPRIPSGAPAYDPVGKAKAPKERNEGFTQALDTVKKYAKKYANSGDYLDRSSELDLALEDVLDFAYDMYYGLQITEDADAVHGLFCLATNVDGAYSGQVGERPDFLSALILSSSIRNNKPALQALESSWDAIAAKKCAPGSSPASSTPRRNFLANLSPTSEPGTAEEGRDTYTTHLSLIVLEPLLKSPKIKAQFLEAGGMAHLLDILLRKEIVWQDLRPKVARIVSDTFLDDEFGATLGVWPTAVKATEDSVCAKGGRESREDGCWEYHLENLSRDSFAEWSQPLLDLLKKRRAEIPAPGRDEL
ncbi:hypothetical protein F5B19DRAFT_393698 [Rostrohypoxylon terebratum]|nr:hypothetical protein F5B19DRAFT_393698 [Rostrohypoxylon terebratum]